MRPREVGFGWSHSRVNLTSQALKNMTPDKAKSGESGLSLHQETFEAPKQVTTLFQAKDYLSCDDTKVVNVDKNHHAAHRKYGNNVCFSETGVIGGVSVLSIFSVDSQSSAARLGGEVSLSFSRLCSFFGSWSRRTFSRLSRRAHPERWRKIHALDAVHGVSRYLWVLPTVWSLASGCGPAAG